MTPRQRILAVFNGERPDRIPFTIYDALLPRGEAEQRLRNQGVGLCTDAGVFSITRPNVTVTTTQFYRDGTLYYRDTLGTPAGEVSQVRRTGGGYNTSRLSEYMIKSPDDYRVVEFLFRDEVYEPTYESYLKRVETIGEAGIVLGGWLPRTPMMCMMWELMSHEQFAIDLHERPDLFFRLYETIAERRREQFRLAAKSPARCLHIGDNITADMIGRERFRDYCIPMYDEFCDLLHEEGKLLAVHMDGRMGPLLDLVAQCKVDIIEAFSPYPDGDVPMADARAAWPEKIIWNNYPSPVHLWPASEIETFTRDLLAAVAPGDRFMIGVTENIPDTDWDKSLSVIADVVRES